MADLVAFRLSTKDVRSLDRLIWEMFSDNALEPLTLEKYEAIPFEELIGRRVKITRDGREALYTVAAHDAHTRTVDMLGKASSHTSLWTYQDVFKAVREAMEACWQNRARPEVWSEFEPMIIERIARKIDVYTVVAGMRGIEMLEGVDDVALGELRLVRSASDFMRTCNLQDDNGLLGQAEQRIEKPCLIGSKTGTLAAVTRWYKSQSFLTAGMFAVEAGASYEHAAITFFIEPEFDNPTGGSGSVYFFWGERAKHLGGNYSFGGRQRLSLSRERVDELSQPGAFTHAFEIFQKPEKTELEGVIVRSVHWYGDAHRDSESAMQFVKYWSCLECLLGGPGEKLTETLALGVVAVLTYGHFCLLEERNWDKNIRTVKRLYKLRSQAVHRAAHTHVTAKDLVTMSAWTAWVIYNAISFSNAKMVRPQTLWDQVQRIAQSRNATANPTDAQTMK